MLESAQRGVVPGAGSCQYQLPADEPKTPESPAADRPNWNQTLEAYSAKWTFCLTSSGQSLSHTVPENTAIVLE